LPYGHQDDRANQRSENEDAIDVEITNPIDDDDLCEQPGANERCDDGTDEAEWKPPANNGLGDEADDRCNDQVNEKVETERPDIVPSLMVTPSARINCRASILSSFFLRK